MKVLEELSESYNKLEAGDIRRTELLNSVGGKLRATQFDALLRQWDTYEKMLKEYSAGTGSMAEEAEKTANSWQGALNELSNTFVSIVNNVEDSDIMIGFIHGANELLEILNKITGVLGSWGTLAAGIGIFSGIKNVGRDKMYSLIYLF